MHELARDLVQRRRPRARDAGRARVQELALARPAARVDGVAHERVHEAGRRLGAQDLGARERAIAPATCASARPVSAATAGRSAPSPSTATARATARGLARQPREPQQHRAATIAREPIARTTSACAASGCTPSVSSARSSWRTSSGLPPVLRGTPRGRRRRARRRAPRDELGRRPAAAGRARRGRSPGRWRSRPAARRRVGLAVRTGRDEHGLALEPPHEVGEEAQRRPVAPVQVVDLEQQRALGREVERQPVEAVQRGEGGVAGGAPSRRRRRRPRAAGAAAPASARGLAQRRASNSWRTTPKANSRSSSPRARVEHARAAARGARAHSASSRDLPIPAGPSISASRPLPPAAPATSSSSAATSRSRSSSRGAPRRRLDGPAGGSRSAQVGSGR